MTEGEIALYVSSSPHVYSRESVRRIMLDVIIALSPATIVSVVIFGWRAFAVISISVATAWVTEWIIIRFLRTNPRLDETKDLSAVVTGLLFALILPVGIPYWIVVLGAIAAIALVKQAFGGIGNNPFNPALAARVILLVSFPLQMTTWAKVGEELAFNRWVVDSVSSATPLDVLRYQGLQRLVESFGGMGPLLRDLFLGRVGGCIGEVSALALLIGAAYLFYRRVITWHIPTTYLLTAAIFSGIFWAIDPSKYANPIFHIASGGIIIGAFFMATDLVTTPVTPRGRLIFGAGCGLITMIIRFFGGYPEGVSFAILIMNAAAPVIDAYTMPRKFGEVKKHG
ncbi:MAG: RnfABCDGE type electron transport complex subunit D [bacterium]